MRKSIVKFGTTTNASGETLSETGNVTGLDAPAWASNKVEYAKMNVVIKITTLSGTAPTVAFKVEELFGGNWIITAISTALTAAGTYVLAQGATPPATMTTSIQGAFWPLGSGMSKRITSTVGGTVGAISVDYYLVFFGE
jgi:hypothetical protein